MLQASGSPKTGQMAHFALVQMAYGAILVGKWLHYANPFLTKCLLLPVLQAFFRAGLV
jgi:hypothetical protein